MKNLLLGLLVLSICSCSKDEDKSNAEQASNKNEQTFLEKYDGKVWYDQDEGYVMFNDQNAFLTFNELDENGDFYDCDKYFIGKQKDLYDYDSLNITITNNFEDNLQFIGYHYDNGQSVNSTWHNTVKIIDNEMLVISHWDDINYWYDSSYDTTTYVQSNIEIPCN